MESLRHSAVIVTVQSAAIIVFYLAIVYVQPYSRGFLPGSSACSPASKSEYNEAWTRD